MYSYANTTPTTEITGNFIINSYNNIIPEIKIDGDIICSNTIFCDNYTSVSDIKYKDDIKDLEDSISVLKKLRPKEYIKKSFNNEHKNKELGFIAQDVEEIEELKFTVHEKDNIKNLNYNNIFVHGINGLMELVKKVEYQDNKIEKLEKIIETMQGEINKLKN